MRPYSYKCWKCHKDSASLIASYPGYKDTYHKLEVNKLVSELLTDEMSEQGYLDFRLCDDCLRFYQEAKRNKHQAQYTNQVIQWNGK